MNINLFDFYLPEELIAQKPSEKRDHSRLLAINKETHTYEDRMFYNILDYLRPGDVLVRNNTKVIPARLIGIKEVTGAHCELLLLKQIEGDVWECLTKPAKSLKVGARVSFGEGKLIGELKEHEYETDDVGWFDVNNLPELSRKVSREEIDRLIDAALTGKTIFD